MTEISQIFSNLSIIFKKYLFDLYRFERFGYAELKVLAVGDLKNNLLNSYAFLFVKYEIIILKIIRLIREIRG